MIREIFARLGFSKVVIDVMKLDKLSGWPALAIVALSLGISAARADIGLYPPAGFEKAEEDSKTISPDGTLLIEQWWKQGGGDIGQSIYQTWIVPKGGNAVRLPEVKLGQRKEMRAIGLENKDDSGSVGFTSDFKFSSDGQYLFREQKIVHGVNGAYLYRHQSGAAYQVFAPDFFIKASKFFTQQTRLKWEDDGTGIVEFSSWESNDGLAVKLRGYITKRQFGVENWRCIFYPANGKFTVPKDWATQNKGAITR
jgi:hypothetical protein